jgi:signal transduction histidine kinase
MNTLVAEIVAAMRFQIENSHAVLHVGALPNCLGDPAQTNQVFANLIDNAIKYRDPTRQPEITIAGRIEGAEAIFSVADNGIGIAPQHQSKAFEIFHRLNPDTSTGEGLGLTIAQRVLERQRGRIWIESQEGKGATFFVSLPVSESQPPAL